MADQEDTALAWSCAADLRSHEEAPGPRPTNGADEPRVALVRRYARQILLGLEADYPRILALRAECVQQAADARRLPEAWRTARARHRQTEQRLSWPHVLRALRWSERRDTAATWTVGAELAHRAAQIMTEAGAQLDEQARAALLAAARSCSADGGSASAQDSTR